MRRLTLLLIVTVLTLVGCGGGGGPSVPQFRYVTQWLVASGGLTGQSQRIRLIDQDNIVQFESSMDKPLALRVIFGVPNGTYHLHVDLFALPGQAGGVVGVLDDLVFINGTTTYTSTTGPAVSSVDVTPASAIILENRTQQFVATAQTASNLPTFTATGGFNWQTTGGIATVDQNGLAIGTNDGVGSVTATQVASSQTGSADLTVEPVVITQSKWTVMVFMNAANNLFPDSTLNMNQMERVAQNPDVRFVVQWKQSSTYSPDSTFNTTRRYLVQPDLTNNIASEIIQDLGPLYDMGSGPNLLDFVNWTKANYPADRYVVIMWNHGNGWKRRGEELITRGVSYDEETGNHIDTWQMAQSLGPGVVDILAWDASLMQQLEVAAEVRDKALYIVGSEESPPEAGYPYDDVFQHFRDNPDDTTLNLAKTFVDETLLAYGSSFKITQSVIDCSQLPGLITATSNLADTLIANQASLTTIAPLVRNNSKKYSDNVVNGRFRDLYDVCQKLADFSAPAPVITAASAVQIAIGQAVVYEGHNANSAGSHGISIDFSSAQQFTNPPPNPPPAADYPNLRFAQETNWGDWLTIAP